MPGIIINGSDNACCKGDFFIFTVSGGQALRVPALPNSLSLAGRAAPHLTDPQGPGKQKRAENSWDLLWIPLCLAGDKNQPGMCCWDVLGRLLSRAFLSQSGMEAEPQGQGEVTSPGILEPPLPCAPRRARHPQI